jgi:hypothetical protein
MKKKTKKEHRKKQRGAVGKWAGGYLSFFLSSEVMPVRS